jgi:hypothetical protein
MRFRLPLSFFSESPLSSPDNNGVSTPRRFQKRIDKVRKIVRDYEDVIAGKDPYAIDLNNSSSAVIIIAQRILFLSQWYARKLMYDALWIRYGSSSKLNAEFVALTKVYQNQGLSAYGQALLEEHNELYLLFQQWSSLLFQGQIFSLDPENIRPIIDDPTKITAQQKEELVKNIRTELEKSPTFATSRFFREYQIGGQDEKESTQQQSSSSLVSLICTSIQKCDGMENVLAIIHEILMKNIIKELASQHEKFLAWFEKMKTVADYHNRKIKFRTLFPQQEYFKTTITVADEDGSAYFSIDATDANDKLKLTAAQLDNEYFCGRLPLNSTVIVKIAPDLVWQAVVDHGSLDHLNSLFPDLTLPSSSLTSP